MDRETLLAVIDFSHGRLMGVLDGIEKNSPNADQVLAWRPGPGRAHIGWQAMHCAATLDKYVNVNVHGGQAKDPGLVGRFGGGTTPSDQDVPTLVIVREALAKGHEEFRKFVAEVTPEEAIRKVASGRTVEESIVLLAWHEAHHQGQIHLTWNLYKQSHGMK